MMEGSNTQLCHSREGGNPAASVHEPYSKFKITRIISCAFFVLALSACSYFGGPSEEGKDHLNLSRVDFADLPGWNTDHVAEALPALVKSCNAIVRRDAGMPMGRAGYPYAWHSACDAIINAHDDAALRQALTSQFNVYEISGRNGADGLFTGYYEATLHGASQPSAQYDIPLYAKPDDWVQADLGKFKKDLAGQKIVGRVVGQEFIPYDSRADIVSNGLAKRAKVLAWVDDSVDAFFLSVQGSGRVVMQDKSVLRVGFDAGNGQRYVAIGRALLDRGLVTSPVSMQKIRNYLNAHPADANHIMNLNPSYIFYRNLGSGENPVGAEGVELTPQRSMAIDPVFVPLGVPLWLATTDGRGAPLERLMVAQDTGGAIKGVVRGDIFWGAGDGAELQAGMMQNTGRVYMILPKAVPVNE